MGERFEQLFQLPRDYYIEGSPVIILAGSLLKDTVSGNVVAQLKYQSVSEKPIKAMKIDITALDVTAKVLPEKVEYQYLDLNIKNGQEFGSNKAIMMPENVTRSFKINNITVIFNDGEQWFCDEAFTALEFSRNLETTLNSDEVVKQYQLSTNRQAKYIPIEDKGLWYCPCGVWNKVDHCAKCLLGKEKAFNSFNVESLKSAMDIRLAEEAECVRIAKEEAEAREKTRKKKNE